jgi:hypothetical protein
VSERETRAWIADAITGPQASSDRWRSPTTHVVTIAQFGRIAQVWHLKLLSKRSASSLFTVEKQLSMTALS